MVIPSGSPGRGGPSGAGCQGEGFKVMPLHDYLEQGITSGTLDYGPIGFAELTAPPELILFDRIGPGQCQVRPSRAWRTA